MSENYRVTAKDLGPIGTAEVDIRPLTVLVGPSNTGKSFFAAALYALHRSLEDSGPGSMFAPVMGRRREAVPAEVRAAITKWATNEGHRRGDQAEMFLWPEGVKEHVGAQVRARLGDAVPGELARCFGAEEAVDLKRWGAKTARLGVVMAESQGFVVWVSGRGGVRLNWGRFAEGLPRGLLRACHHDAVFPYEDDDGRDVWDVDSRTLLDGIRRRTVTRLGPLDGSAYYLPADRTGVMDSHQVIVSAAVRGAALAGVRRAEELPLLSGVMADFIEVLVSRIGRRPRRRARGRVLADRVEGLLGGAVTVGVTESGYPMFGYRPEGRKEDLPFGLASSMVSELAPVVLYLRHMVSPGDLMIIEEPEAHLHPAKQAELAEALGVIVAEGVRLVLTTHSEWLLEKIANLVQRSRLPGRKREKAVSLDARDVGAWLFRPGPAGSTVEELEIDEETGLYPAGYELVSEALYNESAAIFNAGHGGYG